jgi:monovalent cation:proton antiporter-2 (CPA2) family protein
MELQEGVLFLAAAVVMVPIFRRLGLGSVLGYLAGGLLIGPSVLGRIHDPEQILHAAEIGVVFLLFIIGLELQPSRLWAMRGAVFGVGTVQVGVSMLLIGGGAFALGATLPVAAVLGFGLALSSTAFALQVLAERNESTTPHGQAAFGVLLYQDMIVIPGMALIPLLSPVARDVGDAGLMGWLLPMGKALGAILAIVIVGRYLVPRVFRQVSAARTPELSVALALLLVLGTAWIMTQVNLSAGLGAFLAGVLLADTEYCHELESHLEPFKGLLLGLFFLAVGMSIDLALLQAQPGTVLGLAVGLVAVKALVLGAIAWWRKLDRRSTLLFLIAISQGGEFAFVLFKLAKGGQVITSAIYDLMVLVVALSMVLTPLLFVFHDRVLARAPAAGPERAPDAVDDPEASRVLIAGFGRFGQMVGRVLRMKRIRYTALDCNMEQIDFLRRFGNRVYYGDASRPELLRSAGAESAKVLVVAVDDPVRSLAVVEAARHNFPHLRLIVRARNRRHMFQLLQLGVEDVIRETFHSSMEASTQVLMQLGMTEGEALNAVHRFEEFDEQAVRRQAPMMDDMDALQASAKQIAEDLENILQQDEDPDRGVAA